MVDLAQQDCEGCFLIVDTLEFKRCFMNSINKVILLGNLGKDPEVRMSAEGKPIASFSLATSESWSSADGTKQTRTEWHRVVIFNEHLASVTERFLKKGQKIYIEGQLRTRKWTDPNGQEVTIREVVLTRFKGELVIVGDRSNDAPHKESDIDNSPPMSPDAISDDIPF